MVAGLDSRALRCGSRAHVGGGCSSEHCSRVGALRLESGVSLERLWMRAVTHSSHASRPAGHKRPMRTQPTA